MLRQKESLSGMNKLNLFLSAAAALVIFCFAGQNFVAAQTQEVKAQDAAAAASAAAAAQLTDLKKRLDAAETRLKDWANLARYREANTKLSPPNKNEKRVVFMGDSITDNWDNEGYGGFFPGKPYVDRGIGGQTTPQMVLRFRHDVIDLKPEVVVILAGTNDIAGNTGPMVLEDIEDNLKTMCELARLHKIKVVLASLLPVSDYTKAADNTPRIRTAQRPPEKIKALNDWMKNYAAQNNHVYLDYFSALADEKGFLKQELSRDGLHPNLQGYALMSPLAEKAIGQALKK